MNLTLTRKEYLQEGIIGDLYDENGDFHLYTLEHAFSVDGPALAWIPKLAAGVYTCKRGTGAGVDKFKGFHCLHDGVWFDAFEVMDVPPFMEKPVSKILLHHGNYNKNSDGCILLGVGLGRTSQGGRMLTSSNVACEKFMKLQAGLETFILTVIDTNVTPEA